MRVTAGFTYEVLPGAGASPDQLIAIWDGTDPTTAREVGCGTTLTFTAPADSEIVIGVQPSLPSTRATDLDVPPGAVWRVTAAEPAAPGPGGGGGAGPTEPELADDVILGLPSDPADNSDLSIALSQVRTPAPSRGAGSGEVLLGSELSFADALASGALQGDRTLLLNDPDVLELEVLEEIQRLGVDTVRILGGPAAIGEGVEESLEDQSLTVVRSAGASRLETAAEIGRVAGLSTDDAFVARAFPAPGPADPTQAFADSLALGGWAADAGSRILLSQTASLPDATGDALTEDGIANVTIAGGPAAISDRVADALAMLVGTVDRVAGASRFLTALEMAEGRGFTVDSPAATVIAIEGQAANAWAAGFTVAGISADLDAPVVLVNGDDVPEDTAEFLTTAVQPDPGQVALICIAPEAACEATAALLDQRRR